MNKKTKISFVMALLMVASSFMAGAGISEPLNGELCYSFGEVNKTVYNGEEWVKEIYAEPGETVSFKIVATYHKTGPAYEYVDNIVIKDTLGDSLLYVLGSANIEPTGISSDNKIVWWNFTDKLYDGQSIIIEFNATVGDDIENINHVLVTAIEHCSGRYLEGEDEATVFIEEEPPCIPGIEVIKEVWDGNSWAEYVDGLILENIVKFRITINYEDCGNEFQILNMIVEDLLPCCLQYVEGSTIITSTATFIQDPVIEVYNGQVDWKWVNTASLVLEGGQSVTIEFDTYVYQYCEGVSENWAYVTAWGCEGPGGTHFTGEDNASVDCTRPDSTFDKKAWNGNAWTDLIETYQGETIKFKLELEYYGDDEVIDVYIKDELPCILLYVNGSANIEPTGVSEDLKTIWWNLTDEEITHGAKIVIIFYAYVEGHTGTCPECNITYNEAWIKLYVDNEIVYEDYDTAGIKASPMNYAPCKPFIREDGQEGETGKDLTFYVEAEDPEDDDIYYQINWGDVTSGWLGPYTSGVEVEIKHIWNQAGNYTIKARAKDEHGSIGKWGNEISATIIKGDEEPEDIEICFSRLSTKSVKAVLTNNLEENLTNCEWNMTVKGGLLGRINVYGNGTITTLEPGVGQMISAGWGGLLPHLGRITAVVNVLPEGYTEPITKTASGFVIGRFVLIR